MYGYVKIERIYIFTEVRFSDLFFSLKEENRCANFL